MPSVRLTTFQGALVGDGDAGQYVRAEALPLIRSQPGFQGIRIPVNRQAGRVLVEALWESLGAAEAAARSLSRPRTHGAQALGVFDPTSGIFEATLDERV